MNGGGERKLSQAAASILPGCLLAPSYRCLNETHLNNGIVTHFGQRQANGAEI